MRINNDVKKRENHVDFVTLQKRRIYYKAQTESRNIL